MNFSLPITRIFKLLRWFGVVLVLLALGAAGFEMWRQSQGWVKTDNAYLDAPVHSLAARLIGTVDEVLVEENSRVEQGQELIRLDPRDTRIRREQCEAKLAEADAALVAAEAEVVSAKTNVRLAGIRLENARNDLIRMQNLSTGPRPSVARQELDHAQSAHDLAVASVVASRDAVSVSEAGVAVARAQQASAAVTLKDAILQCEYTTIIAPVAGRVGRRNVETGQPVIPAQPLIALVADELWLTANFKETQIAGIQPGQKALIRFDSFPEREWPGTVDSLSPASGSHFALLPPDNATGNFTRVVQRLPVRIHLDESTLQELGGRIAPGLSAEVRIQVAEVVESESTHLPHGKLTQR